jgi:hypothetical protein
MFCLCGCGHKTNLAPYTSKSRGWIKGTPIRFIKNHAARLLKGTQYDYVPTEMRFWKYVNKTESCWEWVGARQKFGYGWFLFYKRYMSSHRASWILHYGLIPKGMFVLHHCDNPSCVNPSHLFLGTQKDNIRDGMQKGRIRLVNLKRGATFAPLNSI